MIERFIDKIGRSDRESKFETFEKAQHETKMLMYGIELTLGWRAATLMLLWKYLAWSEFWAIFALVAYIWK